MSVVGTTYTTQANQPRPRTRSDLFRNWLTDLTPDKVNALVELEAKTRVMASMYTLVNEPDAKHIKDVIRVSDKIRMEYERGTENQPGVGDLQPTGG